MNMRDYLKRAEKNMNEGMSPDQIKLKKIGDDAKKLSDFLDKSSSPNFDQAEKKIKKFAKAALKLDNVLFGEDKKKMEDLATGKFPSGVGNPVMNAALSLVKITR